MACFLVPTAEAVVVKVVEKAVGKNEAASTEGAEKNSSAEKKISLSKKLNWLSSLLFGGSALLLFEHIWHGEVVPYFPFLTAMSDPADTAEMLHEMATAGVCMAVLVTVIWAVICIAADSIVKRSTGDAAEQKAEV